MQFNLVLHILTIHVLLNRFDFFVYGQEEDCDYDYVVVGAGPAGCVFARRAAEQGFTVLLLERGKPQANSKVPSSEKISVALNPRDVRIPYNAVAMLPYNPSSWGTFLTAEAPHLPGNPSSFTGVGNTLGGGSTINALFYGRPSLTEFDDFWPPNWNSTILAQAFQLVEAASSVNENSTERGQSGMLNLEKEHYVTPLQKSLLEAADSLNIRIPKDFNSIQDKEGITFTEFPRKNGLRQDAFTAYIGSAPKDIVDRIIVKTELTVIRIDIGVENDARTARGVYAKSTSNFRNREQYFCANKGVILAAGAVYSPVILEQSGVGDPAILSGLGIPLVLENEQVGRNLQDHLTALIYLRQSFDRNDPNNNPWIRLQERFKYARTGTGFYADSAVKTTLFLKVNNKNGTSTPYADFSAHFVERVFPKELIRRDGTDLQITAHCIDINSTGEVHFSGDPEYPIGSLLRGIPGTVNPNYGQSDADVTCLAKGMTRLRELLIRTGIVLGEEIPGRGFVKYGDEPIEFDSETLRSILPGYRSVSGFHFSSSLALDKVVDRETMQVFGYVTTTLASNQTRAKKEISGLYAIDASIFPRIPRMNTMALTYAASEFGSTLILNTSIFSS